MLTLKLAILLYTFGIIVKEYKSFLNILKFQKESLKKFDNWFSNFWNGQWDTMLKILTKYGSWIINFPEFCSKHQKWLEKLSLLNS